VFAYLHINCNSVELQNIWHWWFSCAENCVKDDNICVFGFTSCQFVSQKTTRKRPKHIYNYCSTITGKGTNHCMCIFCNRWIVLFIRPIRLITNSATMKSFQEISQTLPHLPLADQIGPNSHHWLSQCWCVRLAGMLKQQEPQCYRI